MRVWAVPLAKHGFRPVDRIRNPVRWYLETEDGQILDIGSFETRVSAEIHARNKGWKLFDYYDGPA